MRDQYRCVPGKGYRDPGQMQRELLRGNYADYRKSRMKKLCFPTILWLTVPGPQDRPADPICWCTHRGSKKESRGGAPGATLLRSWLVGIVPLSQQV